MMMMTPLDLILLLSSFVLLIFYYHHLFFGPKNKAQGPHLPPGPLGWPILGNLPQLGPKPHHTLHTLSKIYGPLLRLRFGSVHVLVASSPAVAAECLRANDSNFCNRPPTSGARHMAYNYHDLVFAPYGPRWRMLRKVSAQHLLGPKALDDLRHVRQEELTVLARMLYARAARGEGVAPVSLGVEIHMCSTNALARAMVGRRVFARVEEDEEERKKAEEFHAMVVEVMTLAGVFAIGDFIPSLAWADIGGAVKKMKKVHRRYDNFLNKLIAECRMATAAAEEEGGGGDGGRKRDDLLSVLIGLKEDGDGSEGKISDTDIKALLLNLLTAGTDTSSSTIEWAITEMIRHPDILKKAQQEIDSVVGRDRLVSESDIPKLPYLQAIIKENFRLHPPTPLSLPRLASEECIVNGYKIPKNATLLVNIWGMGRDAKIWPDPLEFRPERFLPGGEAAHVDVRGNHFELIPFGSGRRICSGTTYGIRTVHLTVALLIHAFDWALPVGQTAEKMDMEEAFGISLQKAVPLTAHPIPRLAQKAYGIKG